MKCRQSASNAMSMLAWVMFAGLAWSQEQAADVDSSADDRPAAESAAQVAGEDLAVEQARLADRYRRLEEVLSQLAELSAASDPNRARLLREAIAQSREQDINVRFEAIVKLLEDERLSAAANNQSSLGTELDSLLELLLKADRDKELQSQQDRVREYLKEVARLIRMQKGIRARTEGGDGIRRLADDQQSVADATGKLGGTIKEKEAKNEDREVQGNDPDSKKQSDADGKPSDRAQDDKGKSTEPADNSQRSENSKPSDGAPADGQPSDPGNQPQSDSPPSPPSPGQPSPPSPGGQSESQQRSNSPQETTERATERLRAAHQQMKDARQKLKEAERDGAAERQRAALAELERAKAELERVLRQLREEEMERLLTQLAARFRKMLEIQNLVYDGTVRLDRVAPADRTHDHEIESARLGNQETQIVRETEKALVLLREEGSSLAFPEAIDQMRRDMQDVAIRLAAVKVDKVTQGLEEDIIEALEETIAALDKAAKDLEKKRSPSGQPPAAGQQTEPPLVDKLAELKMIRSLQMRINRRTQRYGEMIDGDQAETLDLLTALADLAERQRRVFQATYDLSQSRND